MVTTKPKATKPTPEGKTVNAKSAVTFSGNTKPPNPKKRSNKLVIPPKKEIPIAAKMTGPGPAAYSLPTTLGPKSVPLSKGTKSPAFSLGARWKPDKPKDTPAPNSVDLSSKTRNGPQSARAVSLKGGFKKTSKDGKDVILVGNGAVADLSTPGPLDYSIKSTAILSKSPAYSLSSRKFYEKPIQTPSPAQYTPKPTPILPHSPAYTFTPQRPLKPTTSSPGPATVGLLDLRKVKPAAPAYTIQPRWRNDDEDLEEFESPSTAGTRRPTTAKTRPETAKSRAKSAATVRQRNRAMTGPSPADYVPKLPGKSFGFSFRTRHSEYEAFVPDEAQFMF